MVIKKISPEQQMLVIEDLYNSTDSISSTRKFNDLYGNIMGPAGKVHMSLNNFTKLLLKTKFRHVDIDLAIKRATGYDVDLGKII